MTKRQRAKRKAEIAAQRRARLDLLPTNLTDHHVLTLREWADVNHISARTARRILGSGTGPRVTQLTARRVGITVAANRAWQASRERVS